MENNFKRKLMAFWLFLWVGIPFMLAQSPMMISGRITDDLGEPMIGVSVLEKGTSNGVITNMEGNYSLKVKQGAVIVYSYIGYVTQELKAVLLPASPCTATSWTMTRISSLTRKPPR